MACGAVVFYRVHLSSQRRIILVRRFFNPAIFATLALMGIKIGIVGLPNVGKSTLFNALTKKSVPAENYPFCTIDPSVGIVAVPDPRLTKLSEFSQSGKTVPATIEFVDIAGLVKGASTGEGLGNKFLSHIREVDTIAHVIRVFKDKYVIHVDNKIEPLSDIETINLELALADLKTVKKRRQSLAREVKQMKKEAMAEEILLSQIEKKLETGEMAGNGTPKDLHLLTAKPMLYVLNISAATENVVIDFKSKLVGEVVEIDPVFGTGLDELITASYKLLKLMTYFTTGADETRAWTVKIGTTAPGAGAAIHGDFREHFIKAEVINCQTLLDVGSYAVARERGLLRIEGKEYIIQDGDVIEFRI